jgi:hypothetical protein
MDTSAIENSLFGLSLHVTRQETFSGTQPTGLHTCVDFCRRGNKLPRSGALYTIALRPQQFGRPLVGIAGGLADTSQTDNTGLRARANGCDDKN